MDSGKFSPLHLEQNLVSGLSSAGCPRCEHDILRTGRISKHEVMRCTTCRGLFLPNANSRFKTSENGILESAIGILEEIVGALF